jgi:hypothetical protein
MNKYNELKPKFQKALKAELKRLELPEPGSIYGFTDEQLQESLSAKEYEIFWQWMYGQTMMMDSKTGKPIVYVEDVLRGVRLIRYGTQTYWD